MVEFRHLLRVCSRELMSDNRWLRDKIVWGRWPPWAMVRAGGRCGLGGSPVVGSHDGPGALCC